MKILKIVGFFILTVMVIILIAVLAQPAKGHIEKSIVINAPAESVFPEVSRFSNFVQWSPWSKMDPGVKQTMEGEEGVVGSKMSWDGEKTGQGSQEVLEIEANRRVKMSLIFGGYEGVSYSEFVLVPEAGATKVTWTYDGDNNGFAGKAMWMVMGSLLGSQYEEGLQDLKTRVEAKPALPATIEAPADSAAAN